MIAVKFENSKNSNLKKKKECKFHWQNSINPKHNNNYKLVKFNTFTHVVLMDVGARVQQSLLISNNEYAWTIDNDDDDDKVCMFVSIYGQMLIWVFIFYLI